MPVEERREYMTVLDEDGETTLWQCNDCGVLIENWMPLCPTCQRWYDERELEVA